MAAAPSGHVAFDHVTPLVCVPVRFAPVRLAPVKFAFERLAFARFAFERLAFERFAFERFAFERFAFVKFTADRFSPEKFDPERFWPEQFEPQVGAALTRKVPVVRRERETAAAEPPAKITVASGSRTAAKSATTPARLMRVEDVGVAVGFA